MTAPDIFDRALERVRRQRRPPVVPRIFTDRIADEVIDRFSLISRSFSQVLVLGPFAPAIAERLDNDARQIFVEGIHLQCDLETLPFADDSMNCIISAFGLETVNDVAGTLIQARRTLKPDGLFLACMFAGDTLHELRTAWIEADIDRSGGASPRIAPFAGVRELGSLLQRAGFALPVTDVDRTILRYPNALCLMREIKQSGFTACLRERARKPAVKTLLAKTAAIYDRQFADPDNRIRATIEIAWLAGWSPHESQQQPLKPGSAKQRLADALKVEEKSLKR